MGLDISAHEKVTLIEAITLKQMQAKNWEHPLYDQDNMRFLWNEAEFSDRSDGLVEGIYRTKGKRHNFRAGSYSGYNEWRRELAKLVGTTDREVWAESDNPVVRKTSFYELINFPDNEGFIGPKTSAKLFADFVEWTDKASKHLTGPSDREWFRDRFLDWQRAFELASKGGVVVFH